MNEMLKSAIILAASFSAEAFAMKTMEQVDYSDEGGFKKLVLWVGKGAIALAVGSLVSTMLTGELDAVEKAVNEASKKAEPKKSKNFPKEKLN